MIIQKLRDTYVDMTTTIDTIIDGDELGEP
jgi:hypothetical protein